ncbi:high frequency lysogenization protein HflD [Candidatus Pantoea multigeneris]|uniref:High frequency lysogenization protein HflD homolog n=1 Tax=Candidatus Pantoea multigeneris TaxID=2608357 RepID=A0ABX0RAL4_9GAMM|nr:high frequency lysogenization protein HflD [Pantoea multigeneris]
MAKNYYEITLALAGICQAAHLTHQLAHQGQCQPEAFTTSLRSLLDLSPTSVLAVYGNQEANLRLGLETLVAVLNSATRQGVGAELTRYTLSLMVLERKLNANKTALNTLAQRISQLDRQLAHYELESDTITSAMAGIYVDVISPLGPRIQVTGSPAVLQNTQVQSRVRATLLAGIRSAVLWQQVGGGRLQLMLSRKQLLREANNLLSRLPPAY